MENMKKKAKFFKGGRFRDRQQAKIMKTRLIGWMKKHEPHKVNDLEQRKLF